METKFLSDGRKVVICGKINQTEYIVQEIFVTKDGGEIPSGENFTAKSLHDTPVESWKVKEEKKLEALMEKRKQEIDALDKKIKDLEIKRSSSAEWLKRNNFLQEKLPEFDWDYFSDVMSGNMKYAVCAEYELRIEELDKVCDDCDSIYYSKSFSGLKAMSLVYKYDIHSNSKSYKFEVGRYSDGTGGSVPWVFCKDKQDLQRIVDECIQTKFDEGRLTLANAREVMKYVNVDPSIIEALTEKHNSELDARYKQALDAAEKIKEGKI